MFKRRGFATVAAFVAAAACSSRGRGSGSQVTPICAQSTTECMCSNAPFTLSSDMSPVANCDRPDSRSGSWVCTYQSTEAQTICDCVLYTCWNGGFTECDCGFIGALTEDAGIFSPEVCPPTSSTTTCCATTSPGSAKATEDGNIWCSCLSLVGASCNAGPEVAVVGCTSTPPSQTPTSGLGVVTAPNCAGLNWPPPGDAVAPFSGSSSGGSSDPCGSGCTGCSKCTTGGCVSCPIGEHGACTC